MTSASGESGLRADAQPGPAAADPAADELLSFDFSASGKGRNILRGGWSGQEAEFIWTNAAISQIELPPFPTEADCVGLSLYLRPHVVPSLRTLQTFRVRIGYTESQPAELREDGWLHLVFSAALFSLGVTLEFDQPDAFRPSECGSTDTRLLGVAIEMLALWPAPPEITHAARGRIYAELERRRKKLPEQFLLENFESLGSNCEFGVLQRSCGIDHVRLLRFAYTPFPSLLAALQSGFSGMGEPGNLVVEPAMENAEYIIRDTCFGIRYHSQIRSDQITPGELVLRERERLAFLRRQMIELLSEADSIFVYVQDFFLGDPIWSHACILQLADCLASYGNNTLLWVTLATSENPAGTVAVLRPGTIIGHVDRLCHPSYPPMKVSGESWRAVCTQAYALWHRWKAQPAAANPPPAPKPELTHSWQILTSTQADTDQDIAAPKGAAGRHSRWRGLAPWLRNTRPE